MSRFVITKLREGPESLRKQLPVTGATVDIRNGPDGQTYFCARLDEPIKHHLDETSAEAADYLSGQLRFDTDGAFLWADVIVMRSSDPEAEPHYGMRQFPVDLALVVDPNYINDQDLDFGKILPIGTAEIDDLPEQNPPNSGIDDPPQTVTPPHASSEPATFENEPETDPSSTYRAPSAPERANAPNADVHTLAGTPESNPTTSTAEAPLEAVLPDEEVTGPVPAGTTARPPEPPAVTEETVSRSPQQHGPPPPPGRFTQTGYPFPAVPATPPPRSAHPGGSPAHAPPWLQDATHRSEPTPPHPHGIQPLPVIPTAPNRRAPSAKTLTIAAAALVGVILVVIAIWNVAGSSSGSDQTATPAVTQTGPSEAEVESLKRLLPKGYSENSCVADDGAPDVSVNCGPNTAPGGPQTATYTLYADPQALNQAFAETIATFDRVICPGNIQSPGPWRRNVAPDNVAGTLFCGTQSGQAAVVWTTDEQSLLNVVKAGTHGPSLDRLYAWWGAHS